MKLRVVSEPVLTGSVPDEHGVLWATYTYGPRRAYWRGVRVPIRFARWMWERSTA